MQKKFNHSGIEFPHAQVKFLSKRSCKSTSPLGFWIVPQTLNIAQLFEFSTNYARFGIGSINICCSIKIKVCQLKDVKNCVFESIGNFFAWTMVFWI